ncbi:MAG: hypothetical protein KGL78_06545 [Burkholderiales bacterium]|nr:hypothetical protein [Burkholderiales bacterium]
MDAQQLLSEFLASGHGEQAMDALRAQGVDDASAQQMLGHAVDAATAQADEHHGGRNFFAAFASGLVRGDGFMKSLVDGGEGMLAGRVAESMASRAGVDGSTAATLAAAATPFLVSFLKNKLA